MPYTLKFSDPTTSTFITVPDMPPGINTIDTDLSLLGRGYPNYGQKTAENFLHLLENFSSGTEPAHAIQGQLWYDNTTNKLKINTTRHGQSWAPVNGVWQQPIDPGLSNTTVFPGDLWVNTSDNNYILSVRTNSNSWVQVSNTSTGVTGSFSTEIFDSTGQPHWVVEHKSLGVIVAIDTADQFYPNPVIPNFTSQLSTGTNMTTSGKFWGTAYSADALNLYPGALTLRIPTERFLIKDDIAGGDIPGQGQIITGRVFFQNSDNATGANSPRGLALTSADDSYGTSKGLIQIYKSGNDLVLSNDRNPDYGYGNILLNTKLGLGSVKIGSYAKSVSTTTGALTVAGGVGIAGDLWVSGDIHAGHFVSGFADNVHGGKSGQLVYQKNTSISDFVTTATAGSSVLVSGGVHAPYFQDTSTVHVGYSDNASRLLGGVAGQFVIQTGTNQTGFLDGSLLTVSTATNAFNLNGPAGTIPVQASDNRTEYRTTGSVQVGYAVNILGGAPGQFLIQTGTNQTVAVNPTTLAIGNLTGGVLGSIPYQTGTNATVMLPVGTVGQYLKSTGTTPQWTDPVGITANQVAFGRGPNSELGGDVGMTYNPLTQILTVSGDVIAGSDREIKDNIQTLDNALEKTLSLRGVSFNYKKSGRPNIGLIAQEVQEIVPEVVSVNESTGFLGIGYGALVGLLVEAIKEQQAQIDELKRRIG
jgi:Chaperone of endosialidase